MSFHNIFHYLMIQVPAVPNCQPDASQSVGGTKAVLVRPITPVWSWFSGNMAAPFSEDLNEVSRELVKDISDLAGSVDKELGKHSEFIYLFKHLFKQTGNLSKVSLVSTDRKQISKLIQK